MKLKHKVVKYAVNIVTQLQEAGYEAYIVGGAVRDLLLGKTPKDYDISTIATPEQIRKVFGRRKCRIIGRRFKLVHLYVGKEVVEISTFRRTPKKKQPVHLKKRFKTPEKMIFHDNEYGSVEEDASRRDFTVNALYYDPITDKIRDFTGNGLKDIKKGLVRVIGDPHTRFEEDPVRVLRALKLVGQYNFRMTKDTEKALKSSLNLLAHVAPARLCLEFEKIMLSPYCVEILTTLKKYGLLSYIAPYIDEKWDSSEAAYMRELLKIKAERTANNEYRSSISISLAALILPFLEKEIGFADTGALWMNNQHTKSEIRDLLTEIIYPHNFCKDILHATTRILALQPDFVENWDRTLTACKGYQHARELMVLQNKALWHDDRLENIWPKYPPSNRRTKSRRSGRFHDKKRK